MKKIVSFILIIFSSISSPSFVLSDAVSCSEIGKIAKTIMEGRQIEVPISTMMDAITSNIEEGDGQAALRKLVILAYEMPSYSTKEMQQSMVAEFRNQIELKCYKARN